jgi:UDP-2,4-diacetamido-2,4,6-trideoxy-beta-L-altropyranose hydrolase
MEHEPQVALRLREATRRDVPAIWRLRNSPDVRAASRRQHELDPVEFEQEIVAAIERASNQVLAVDVDGEAVGYVRIEPLRGDEFEISIALDVALRGQGLGTRVIAQATDAFLGGHPGAALVALTRADNVASGYAFEAAGYGAAGTDGEFRVYRAEGA